MNNIQYKKLGAMVSVSQDGATQTYKIEREGKTLEMSFTRQQSAKSEKYTRSMGGGASSAIKGDYIALYDVGVCIDDEKRNFAVSFAAKHFDEWGDRTPGYKVDLSKGIPVEEHKLLYKGLSEQNSAVAQAMKDYVLDADELQKCNNLQQSVFNQKLEEFLSFNK